MREGESEAEAMLLARLERRTGAGRDARTVVAHRELGLSPAECDVQLDFSGAFRERRIGRIAEQVDECMNLSGAGIGGTVALSATSPDLVVELLTDAGTSVSERYHLAEDGKHLELHVRVKAADATQAREYVRVFDRDDAGRAN